MAVRDDEQRQRTGTKVGQVLPWRDALGHLPAVVLVSGLLMYGYLSICYERFYRSLGVDPNDVGLTYAGTLARSSGFAAVIIVISLGVYTAHYLVPQHPTADTAKPMFRVPRWRFPAVLWLWLLYYVGGLLIILMVLILVFQAESAASDVKAGKAVGPVRIPDYLFVPPFLWDVPVLAVHADPATVEATGKPGDSPAAERLRGRRLLYLGQSGGTVVLYDAAVQRALYVPASSIILQVTNCQAKPPPDAACQ
jgi:hypothetical protein